MKISELKPGDHYKHTDAPGIFIVIDPNTGPQEYQQAYKQFATAGEVVTVNKFTGRIGWDYGYEEVVQVDPKTGEPVTPKTSDRLAPGTRFRANDGSLCLKVHGPGFVILESSRDEWVNSYRDTIWDVNPV